MELRRVIIATDFSNHSLHAARWAVNHFVGDLDVVLTHAVALPEPPRFMRGRFPQMATVAESAKIGAMNRLGEFARSVGARDARLEVRVGSPAQQIADLAREVGTDLIIVGRHGDQPGVLHRLGTTADRLVKIAPAPVLLATGLRDTRPRHILAALDDADITPDVVAWTHLLATRFDAEVAAVHVVTSAIVSHLLSGERAGDEKGAADHATIRADVVDHGEKWMRGLFHGPRTLPRLSTEVGFGMVAHEIVAAAERHDSDLIVLGRTGAGLGRRVPPGSVARHVLHTARCPVLVIVESEDAIVEAEGAG